MPVKRTIADDATILTVSKIFNLAFQMVIIMLLSRFRSLKEYGTYTQLLMSITLVTDIIILGLPNSLSYFLGRSTKDEERNHFLSVFYTLISIVGVVVALLLVANINLLVLFFSNETIVDFRFFLILFPWSQIIISSVDNLLVYYGKIWTLVIFKIISSLIGLFSVVICQVINQPFIVYMWLYTVLQCFLALSVYFIACHAGGKLHFTIDVNLIRTIFVYSIPIGLATLVGTISLELDKLFIARILDTESVALYANAAKELPLTIVANSLTAILLPLMARLISDEKWDKAIDIWGSAVTLSYIVIAFFVTSVFVFAKEAMVFLYSDKFLPGLPVFRIYIVVLLFRVTYFGMILNAAGRTNFIFYSSIIALIANVILNFVLYYIVGFIGPALATLVAVVITNLSQLVYTCYIVKIPFSKIFPWAALGKISVVNIGFGVAFYVVRLQFIELFNPTLFAFAMGFVWLLLYGLFEKKQIIREYRKLR